MTKRRAIIETDGAGHLLGVWVADVDQGAPDVAFLDEIDQFMAERKLGEGYAAIEAHPEQTWGGFMDWLEASQHPLIHRRYAGTTELSPAELLAAAEPNQTGDHFRELLGLPPQEPVG